MSTARNLKRILDRSETQPSKKQQVVSLDVDDEKKVEPAQLENSQQQVTVHVTEKPVEIKLTPATRALIASKAKDSALTVINALKKLKSCNIVITPSIFKSVVKSKQYAISTCNGILLLNDNGIELTDYILDSIAGIKGSDIATVLQALHKCGIPLANKIIAAVNTAAPSDNEKDCFFALLSLHYMEYLSIYSIRAITKAEQNPYSLMSQYVGKEFAENLTTMRAFDAFEEAPETQNVIPLPAPLKFLVRTFFSTELNMPTQKELTEHYKTHALINK